MQSWTSFQTASFHNKWTIGAKLEVKDVRNNKSRVCLRRFRRRLFLGVESLRVILRKVLWKPRMFQMMKSEVHELWGHLCVSSPRGNTAWEQSRASSQLQTSRLSLRNSSLLGTRMFVTRLWHAVKVQAVVTLAYVCVRCEVIKIFAWQMMKEANKNNDGRITYRWSTRFINVPAWMQLLIRRLRDWVICCCSKVTHF